MSAEAVAHHDEHSVLAHHFDNIEQQRATMRLGMWMFLVTEALFFGGAFAAYTAYRVWYSADFQAGSSKLNVFIALINSMLLLTSSLTITLAIHAAHLGEKKKLNWMLLTTAVLGILFLCLKAKEYHDDYEEGLVPGMNFDAEQFTKMSPTIEPGRVQIFFMFYYIMTGIHVVHLIVGIGLVLWLWSKAVRGEITVNKFMLVEITSLYWHFVDVIWLFILPVLYLAGTHSFTH